MAISHQGRGFVAIFLSTYFMSQTDTTIRDLSTVPVPVAGSLSVRIDEQLHDEAKEYLRAGRQGAANSQRAYATDLRQYLAWCLENGYEPIPLSARSPGAVRHLPGTDPFLLYRAATPGQRGQVSSAAER